MKKSILRILNLAVTAALVCAGCTYENNSWYNVGNSGGGSYTITFDPNGGTVSLTSDKTGEGRQLDSLPTPTRNGYTFNGWYTTSTGGEGTKVTEDKVYSANTTIYAQWTLIGYNITYDLDGGSVSSDNPVSYTVEATTITLRNPTKTGYTFAGWTGTNGTTPRTTISIPRGSTGDKSYTAQWTLNRYRITFNAKDGTVTPAFDSTGVGWTLASLPTPTRDGYTFNGWWTAATGGDSVTVSMVYSANTNIYAKWNAIYTVTFNSQSGSSVSSQTIDHGGKVTSPTAPTRAGYTFGGWYMEAACTTAWNFGTDVVTSAITLYAKWNAVYTVTFNANGGTVTPTSGTTGEGGILSSLPTPTRDGCTFNGWFTALTGGTKVTEDKVYSANATIYAQWTLTTYTFADSRDSKSYKRVQIGNQVWMAENLNYDVPDDTTDVCYRNSADSCVKYGRLYDWGTAMGLERSYYGTVWGGSDVKHQGVCPVGWHLPSNAEWTQLTDFVGGSSKAGTKLKSTSGWYNNGNGTDEYGFSALPGGMGMGGSFDGAGCYGSWWSATEDDADYA
jgi:uncharacterized protein (TIGR02145 family)/uncharacterized repeat protein (TIGR02543 family)